jgi:hypothetical protein
MITALLSMFLVFAQPPTVTSSTNAVAPPAPAADTVPPFAI